MENCEHCGKPIGEPDRWGSNCDGELTLGPDPFAEEIHDDHTDYWMCEGARYESAMDI